MNGMTPFGAGHVPGVPAGGQMHEKFNLNNSMHVILRNETGVQPK